ncbi:hypothetical protein R1C46_18490 [Bacillus tropicus]
MDIDLLQKFLVPLVSAIAGGLISYKLSRIKEKKEEAIKRLESLYEIQNINYKMLGSFSDLEQSLNTYVLSTEIVEPHSQLIVTNKIKECSDALAEFYVLTLANAVYLNKGVFNRAKKTHEDIRFLFVNVMKYNYTKTNGKLKVYTQTNLDFLRQATEKIAMFQDTLAEKIEPKLVKHYMEKYNKSYNFNVKKTD